MAWATPEEVCDARERLEFRANILRSIMEHKKSELAGLQDDLEVMEAAITLLAKAENALSTGEE